MPITLQHILADTRATLPALRARHRELERAASGGPLPPSFVEALQGSRLGLVAEVKRRSPSAGTIARDLDPVAHATSYAQAGAHAVSVLTDGPHFGGSLEDLRHVTEAVGIPALRKDFILDESQILEARLAGAAAILLIVRALSPERLRQLVRFAAEWGLAALVEVHDEAELDLALESGARIVGVNSRNLDTFLVDVAAAWRLLQRIPPDRIAIAESGMSSVDDAWHAAQSGADAVLIGTALSASPHPGAMIREIVRLKRQQR